MNIAIVGSGIAGLSAAWLLGRYHRVSLFERHASPGMGAFNLDYVCGDTRVRIDVPLRAFNQCHYRNLVAFYRLMGIDMQRTDHAAAYSRPNGRRPYFSYRYFDLGPYALPYPEAHSLWSRRTASIVRDAARFLTQAKWDRYRGETTGLTIDAYLHQKNYSGVFIDEVLVPSFAAIGTCSYRAIRNYPADAIIDFLASGMLFNGIWRVGSGAETAIARMLEPCHALHCHSDIRAIRQQPLGAGGPRVILEDQHGQQHGFDQVILAVQANQAAAMLGNTDALAPALAHLAAVGYERSEVVVHSDLRLAPGYGKSRAPVLFEVDERHDKPMASICLNPLYPSLAKAPPLFQTWNPLREPDPDKVLGRAFFERPLVTPYSQQCMAQLQAWQQQPDQCIAFVGSYAMPGVPLLESALQSAMSLAPRFGFDIPWRL